MLKTIKVTQSVFFQLEEIRIELSKRTKKNVTKSELLSVLLSRSLRPKTQVSDDENYKQTYED